MAAEWYYAKGDKQIGPVTEDDLRALAQSGQLSSTDKVWKDGMADWLPAGDIKGLFPGAPGRKSPPPLKPAATATAWEHEDRSGLSSEQMIGLAVAAGLGVLGLLIPIVSVATGTNFWIFAPLFLIAAPLVLVFWVFNGWMLSGRWTPADGARGWVEFHRGGVFKREDGSAGTFTVSRNKKLIDFTEGSMRIESWRILAWGTTTLEVQGGDGKTRSFKKGLTLAEQNANPFRTVRTKHLIGSWQPLTEANEWMEFTRDGAVVFSNGSAGKFTVSGDEPNEVIDLEMVGGATRRFRVVSLTPMQLVIAEGDEATTFRRPGKVAKSRDNGAGVASAADGNGAGVLGGLFSLFTRWKCPKCGQRSAEKTRSEGVGDRTQEVRSRYDPAAGRVRQVVVTLHTLQNHFQCKQCNHQWTELEECDRIA